MEISIFMAETDIGVVTASRGQTSTSVREGKTGAVREKVIKYCRSGREAKVIYKNHLGCHRDHGADEETRIVLGGAFAMVS